MVLPNGSRLSCGASAGGRKRPALRDRPAAAQMPASFESQPRQLQAHVRQHGGYEGRVAGGRRNGLPRNRTAWQRPRHTATKTETPEEAPSPRSQVWTPRGM